MAAWNKKMDGWKNKHPVPTGPSDEELSWQKEYNDLMKRKPKQSLEARTSAWNKAYNDRS